MKYDIICKLMWLMFKNSFSSTLKNDLKFMNELNLTEYTLPYVL